MVETGWALRRAELRRGVVAMKTYFIDPFTTRLEDSVSNSGMTAPGFFTTFVTTRLANYLAVCVMLGTLSFVAIGSYIGWSLGEGFFDVPEGWSLDAAMALLFGVLFGG
jgi:hypothetical protein